MNLPTLKEVEESPEVLLDVTISGRRTVGVRDVIVKYGHQVSIKEAETLAFVATHTSLPVPKLLDARKCDNGKTYIFMSRLRGTSLAENLSTLPAAEMDNIIEQLSSYMKELRSLRITDFEKRSYIGSIAQGPCTDGIFAAGIESKGPFNTEEDMYENILERWGNIFKPPLPQAYTELARRMYKENSGHDICFTHGDIVPRNILIESGSVTGILDWGQAGWYPEYWEYVKTMWGCHDTWDTNWPLQVGKILKPYDYMRLIDEPIRQACC